VFWRRKGENGIGGKREDLGVRDYWKRNERKGSVQKDVILWKGRGYYAVKVIAIERYYVY
jgi:hypothetical protein